MVKHERPRLCSGKLAQRIHEDDRLRTWSRRVVLQMVNRPTACADNFSPAAHRHPVADAVQPSSGIVVVAHCRPPRPCPDEGLLRTSRTEFVRLALADWERIAADQVQPTGDFTDSAATPVLLAWSGPTLQSTGVTQ